MKTKIIIASVAFILLLIVSVEYIVGIILHFHKIDKETYGCGFLSMMDRHYHS
jgi:hypothetical protein